MESICRAAREIFQLRGNSPGSRKLFKIVEMNMTERFITSCFHSDEHLLTSCFHSDEHLLTSCFHSDEHFLTSYFHSDERFEKIRLW